MLVYKVQLYKHEGISVTSSVPLLELSRGVSHSWVPGSVLAPSSVLLRST